MKQPYQMTFEEYVDYMLNDKPMDNLFERPKKSASSSLRLRLRTKHAALVREALLRAEPIPENVLKEYPELWGKRNGG